MARNKHEKQRIRPRGFLVLLVALSGCHGAGPWYRNQNVPGTNVAYRPIYPPKRGRPFYVSGYGGFDYSPNRPRKIRNINGGTPVAPTTMPAPNVPTVSISEGNWGPE